MNYEDIEKKADGLTEVYSEAPIPVYEIIRSKGIEVYEAEFRVRVKNVHGFCDFVGGAIYLNNVDTPTQQIYTAAHELGHWVLHKSKYEGKNKRYACLPKGNAVGFDIDEEEEDQANFFASRLLVPRLLLRPYRSYNNSIASLAKEFNVSRDLMERRVRGE